MESIATIVIPLTTVATLAIVDVCRGPSYVCDPWKIVSRDHSFSTYAKFCEKLAFFDPLIRTRTCPYQGVRNVSSSENFAYVLNK